MDKLTGKVSAYRKRVEERDKAREKLSVLEKKVWKLQQLARMGTMEGCPVSPYNDLEGNEEGPPLTEKELRKSILEIEIWAS